MKKWFKDHWLEGIGVGAAVILLVFVWLGRGKAPSNLTAGPGAAGSAPSGGGGGSSAPGVSSGDLNAAVQALQGQFGDALNSLAQSLSQAEGADISAVRDELKVQAGKLDTVQKGLQDQIKALSDSTDAKDVALRDSLKAQADALSSLQSSTQDSINQLRQGSQLSQDQIFALGQAIYRTNYLNRQASQLPSWFQVGNPQPFINR